MIPAPDTPRPDTRVRFLRVLGTIWLVVMVLTLGGVALAPHAGQIADVVLQQTVYRQWTRLTLEAEQAFFDVSTPVSTVHSYYSALYHGHLERMERLTQGAFREQMRLRLASASTAPAFTPYRSFLQVEMQGEQAALVSEKFHLFWQQGLRFRLQREAAHWHIVSLEPLQ